MLNQPGKTTMLTTPTQAPAPLRQPGLAVKRLTMATMFTTLLSSAKSPINTAFLLSIINQVVTSGGNFMAGVYLVRTLHLADYGIYGLGYGICLLYVGVGNALILTQMTVNISDRPQAERPAYAAQMFLCMLLLIAATMVLLALSLGVALLIDGSLKRFAGTVAAIAVASVFSLCNEFFADYAYIRRKEALALAINGVSVALFGAALLVAAQTGVALTPQLVLLLYGGGAALGAALGFLFSPLQIRAANTALLPVLGESWHHGRWALGGMLVSWLQTQTYIYVLAFFLGPTGAGQANAARIFISPFAMLLPAINKIVTPRLADLRQTDGRQMFRLTLLLSIGLTLLALTYCLILLSGLDYVTRLVLGRRDPAVLTLVWVWCVVLTLQMNRSCGSLLLQVIRKYRVLTLINIPSALAAIAVAIILIMWLGAAGAIWGMVAGEIVLSLLVWREIKHAQLDDH